MRFFNAVVLAAALAVSTITDFALGTTNNDTVFENLSGDVVVIHGWAGAKLIDTSDGNRVVWLTEGIMNNTEHPNINLPITHRGNAPHHIVNAGFLESSSFLDFYTPFLDAIQSAAVNSGGRFSVHLFDYDWRLDNVVNTLKFVDYLRHLRSNNGRNITIISHSMGGILSLGAIHLAPGLVQRAVFAGPPFNGSITPLHDRLEGAPFGTNTELFNADNHFLLRSSFCFFPFDNSGLVHASNGTAFPIDYFKPSSWFEYKLAANLKTTATTSLGTYGQRVAYTTYAVLMAAVIRGLMKPIPGFHYPKIAIIAGNAHDTIDRYPATRNPDGSLNVDYASALTVPGDGLITEYSVRLPAGIPHQVFNTTEGHMTLLNDFNAVKLAIDYVSA
jgi:pimeloyl-ACP methyl ester carboxylesterase